MSDKNSDKPNAQAPAATPPKLTNVQYAHLALKDCDAAQSAIAQQRYLALAQVHAILAMVDCLDTLSNDVAALCNMMADAEQERERKRNSLPYRDPGIG